MTAVPRAAAASARPEAAAEPRRAGGALVPLVRLLARQAAREFLLTHPAANDNQPSPAMPANGE